MMQSKEIENRKRIVAQFIENPTTSASSIAKLLKLPRSTVIGVLKRYKETLTVNRSKGGGRKPGPVDKNLHQKIIRSIKQNPGLSDGDRAKRYGTSITTVRKTRLRAGYKSYHARKHPNRNDKQSLVAKKRARILYENVLTKFDGCILMDDETYVKTDFKQVPGQKFYVSTHRGYVADKYKHILVDKFAKKFMVWQAICSCGLKTDVFITSSYMTSDLYMKECLEKRILKFVRQHQGPVKFWPDLASCHYSKATQKWYEDNGIDYIVKTMNPPNCPDLRPIELYWAIIKKKLFKNGGSAETIEKMRQKWRKYAGEVDEATVQKLMGSIKTKTRRFIRTSSL
jgi:transposase